MILILLRHGRAVDRDDPKSPPDPERSLTRDGRRRTEAAVRGLARLVPKGAIIVSSPYRRARETADIVAAALGRRAGKVSITDALLPSAQPARLVSELASKKASAVVCCGHAPQLDRLAAALLGAARPLTKLKKAGALVLEVASLKRGRATLLALLTPALLRRLGD